MRCPICGWNMSVKKDEEHFGPGNVIPYNSYTCDNCQITVKSGKYAYILIYLAIIILIVFPIVSFISIYFDLFTMHGLTSTLFLILVVCVFGISHASIFFYLIHMTFKDIKNKFLMASKKAKHGTSLKNKEKNLLRSALQDGKADERMKLFWFYTLQYYNLILFIPIILIFLGLFLFFIYMKSQIILLIAGFFVLSLLLFILIVIVLFILTFCFWTNYYFQLENDKISIRSGFLSTRKIEIKYMDIKDVSLESSLPRMYRAIQFKGYINVVSSNNFDENFLQNIIISSKESDAYNAWELTRIFSGRNILGIRNPEPIVKYLRKKQKCYKETN